MADTIIKPIVIDEVAFPTISDGQVIQPVVGGSTAETLQPVETAPRTFPSMQIASAVIADSIDTQSRRILADYSFGEYGSIRIGKYENGVSGEISLTPNGIVAKNKNGETTLTIDGSTGDATFKGTIAANSLIAGRTDIGTTGGNVYIDGNNNRIIISDGTNDRILIGYQSSGF